VAGPAGLVLDDVVGWASPPPPHPRRNTGRRELQDCFMPGLASAYRSSCIDIEIENG
jgi:hypothetical protein